jgi:hypothetical protein
VPKIFISYRRADSAGITVAIYRELVRAFGEENVFKDVESIQGGQDFGLVLRQQVNSCEVLLVVIGAEWLTITDKESGQRRLDDPADWVRIEVETGLRRGDDMLVIPVLVDDARMPRRDSLPASLHELCNRNSMPVRHDPDFEWDMSRLNQTIKRHIGTSPRLPWTFAAVITAVLVVAIIATLLWSRLQPDPDSGTFATDEFSTRVAIAAQTLVGSSSGDLSFDTPSPTPTITPTLTPTLSGTDIEGTIQAEMNIVLTGNALTAAFNALATAEPTLDTRAIAYARLTQTQDAVIAQATNEANFTATQYALATATATLWTPTFTPTLPPQTAEQERIMRAAFNITDAFEGGGTDEATLESYWTVAQDLSIKPRGIVTPLGQALIFDMAINHGTRNGFLQEAEELLGVPPNSIVGENGITEEQLIQTLAELRLETIYRLAERDNLPGLRVRADFWISLIESGDWQLQGDADGNVTIREGRIVQVRNP